MKGLNKKGSHVSFVLSFVIFVVALLFMYILVTTSLPQENTKKNSFSLLKENVVKNLTSDIWVIRAYDNVSLPDECVKMPKPEDIVGGSTIAIDQYGSIESTISGDDILVEGEKDFIKVYYSSFIQNQNVLSSSGCVALTPDSVKKEKKISESQILDLMSRFSNNYSSLKETFEIPSGMDFDLYFEYENGSTIGKIVEDSSVEIYSEELKIYYLSSTTSEKEGTLRVRIW